jgi:hypothetical protein
LLASARQASGLQHGLAVLLMEQTAFFVKQTGEGVALTAGA